MKRVHMKGMLWIFVLFTMVGAYADIGVKSLTHVKQINKGLKYVRAEGKRHITKRRLKRYYLATEASKPFFSSINDDILALYMAAFLQNAHPHWLEDDLFVFHTSSSKRYLNRLKRLYKKRYNIETVVYKNKKYRKGSFELRSVDYDDIKTYMDEHISSYFTNKKKNHHKAKRKKTSPKKRETKAIKVATISSKKEANLVYAALRYIDKHKKQSSTTLGRYILYTKAEAPSFFGSMDGIYNLYLTGILNGAHPKWLADERFVFHSASSIAYVKRLKRLYQKRYGIYLYIAKGTTHRVKLKSMDSDDLKEYMQERIPKKYIRKAIKSKVSKADKKREAEKKRLAKKRLAKKRKKRVQEQRDAIAKAQKRVEEKKRKIRAKKAALAKKEKEAKKRAKAHKKATVSAKKTESKLHALNRDVEAKLWQEKKRALELERQQLEKEKKALAEAKKRLAEEKASRERIEKRRALEKEKEAKEKRRIEKQKAREAEKKRREEQKRKATKEKAMQKKLAEKRAAEKKAAALAKQKAAAKKKKDDALTSELDQMLEETSNFKKKLERSESIKYY